MSAGTHLRAVRGLVSMKRRSGGEPLVKLRPRKLSQFHQKLTEDVVGPGKLLIHAGNCI